MALLRAALFPHHNSLRNVRPTSSKIYEKLLQYVFAVDQVAHADALVRQMRMVRCLAWEEYKNQTQP
jgi:hypothetical protein